MNDAAVSAANIAQERGMKLTEQLKSSSSSSVDTPQSSSQSSTSSYEAVESTNTTNVVKPSQQQQIYTDSGTGNASAGASAGISAAASTTTSSSSTSPVVKPSQTNKGYITDSGTGNASAGIEAGVSAASNTSSAPAVTYNPDDGGGSIYTGNGSYNGSLAYDTGEEDPNAERKIAAARALAAIHEDVNLAKSNQEKTVKEFDSDTVNGIPILAGLGDEDGVLQDSVNGLDQESIGNAKTAVDKIQNDYEKIKEDIKKFQQEYGDLNIATEELEMLDKEAYEQIKTAEETKSEITALEKK